MAVIEVGADEVCREVGEVVVEVSRCTEKLAALSCGLRPILTF